MKNRLLLSLVVSAITLPGWAQNSANSPVPANNSASQSDREPLQAPKPKNYWDGDDPNLVNLVAHPFASKAYVRRQTAPIHDRINELDELTSENSRMIKDVDSRAQQGIQMASEKSSLADQHATEANNKAVLAKTSATEASDRVSAVERAVGSLDQYKGGAQTEIHFRPGQSVLSKSAKDAIDTMAAPLASERSYRIEIRGFAPGHGRVATANAQKMSNSVVRYLVLTHKIPMYRISVLNTDAGKVTQSHKASRGRVEISVLEQGTMSTAQR
jgi:outer membrane protein OmpA-like peptidoglycan-associated protein